MFLFGKQQEIQNQKINEFICSPMVFSFRITIYFLPIFFDFFEPKTSLSVLEVYNAVLPICIANIFFLHVKFTGQCKKEYSKEIAVAWKIKLCNIWAQHTSWARYECYRKGSDPINSYQVGLLGYLMWGKLPRF